MLNDEHFVPRAQGLALDTDPKCFGEFLDSSSLLSDPEALRSRMTESGYLFLRGFFEREQVLAARRTVVDRMDAKGWLAPGTEPMEGILREGLSLSFEPSLGENNVELEELLYAGRLMEFYRAFFGEDVLHFDYTWFRAVGPGFGTPPHCDVVYMGRGTRERLFTTWVQGNFI